METRSRVGVFIGRMQPPHAGHISVIKKMVEENDEVILLHLLLLMATLRKTNGCYAFAI